MFSSFLYFPKDYLSSLTPFVEDTFISDHLCPGEDSDEHDHGEECDDESCDSYIEDDDEWLSDFMEDPFYESRQCSDEAAAEILGSPSKRKKLDGENICGICLDPLEKFDGEMKELPCKHIYHYSCILESTKTKNTCPTCRGEYDCRGKDYCEKEMKNTYLFHESRQYSAEEHQQLLKTSLTRIADALNSLARILKEQQERLLKAEAAEILGSRSKGMKCDGKNICLHLLENMKELPCKHINHYSCLLESTKVKYHLYFSTGCLIRKPVINTRFVCLGNVTMRNTRFVKESQFFKSFLNTLLQLGGIWNRTSLSVQWKKLLRFLMNLQRFRDRLENGKFLTNNKLWLCSNFRQ